MLLPALYRSLVFFNFFVSRVSLCQISLEKSSSVFFLCLNSDAFPVLSKILGQKLPVIILFVFFLWKFQIMTHLGHKSPPPPPFCILASLKVLVSPIVSSSLTVIYSSFRILYFCPLCHIFLMFP